MRAGRSIVVQRDFHIQALSIFSNDISYTLNFSPASPKQKLPSNVEKSSFERSTYYYARS